MDRCYGRRASQKKKVRVLLAYTVFTVLTLLDIVLSAVPDILPQRHPSQSSPPLWCPCAVASPSQLAARASDFIHGPHVSQPRPRMLLEITLTMSLSLHPAPFANPRARLWWLLNLVSGFLCMASKTFLYISNRVDVCITFP